MRFHETIKYKLKHLISTAMIAGATLLPASCCKNRIDPNQPHHNTTYVWGSGNWDNVWPEKTDNVAKSADSTLVDCVFLKNDGKSLEGSYTHNIWKYMNKITESVSPGNRYKVRGAGTLTDAAMETKEDIQDSIKLSKFGFTFGRVIYSPMFQR